MTTPLWYQGGTALGPPPPPAAGDGSPTLSLQPTSTTRLQTQETAAPDKGSNWSQALLNITSALTPLAQTGLDYNQQRIDRKLAEKQTALEHNSALARTQMAQSNLELAKVQQQRVQMQATTQQAAAQQQSNNTMMYALIGGGVLIGGLALVMAMKK